MPSPPTIVHTALNLKVLCSLLNIEYILNFEKKLYNLIDWLEVTKKQESAVSRLQAQITSLTQFEKNVNNTMIGHDTIISISFWRINLERNLTNLIQCLQPSTPKPMDYIQLPLKTHSRTFTTKALLKIISWKVRRTWWLIHLAKIIRILIFKCLWFI